MKSFFVKASTLLLIFGFTFSAYAGTRINEVWQCTVNEGQTIDDVKTANHKWVKYVNKSVKGGDIQSYVASVLVGKLDYFVYVDSFPNIISWNNKNTAMDAAEGKKLEQELNKVAKCKSNTLYSVEES